MSYTRNSLMVFARSAQSGSDSDALTVRILHSLDEIAPPDGSLYSQPIFISAMKRRWMDPFESATTTSPRRIFDCRISLISGMAGIRILCGAQWVVVRAPWFSPRHIRLSVVQADGGRLDRWLTLINVSLSCNIFLTSSHLGYHTYQPLNYYQEISTINLRAWKC